MRYYGKVGFYKTSETEPGDWEEELIVREYSGDVHRNLKRSGNEKMNDTVTISNSISIVADPFALENYFCARFLEWNGARWRINSVEIKYPRLYFEIGEIYNG